MIFHKIAEAHAELERREQLGDARGLPPYVAVVDEFPELLRRLNDRDEARLRDALLVIGGLSGRKFKVATIVMGQSWKNSVVGSTEMRDLVGAQAVFRMRKDEALLMTNLRSDYWNPDPLLLQKGEAFICGVVSGAVLVRVPPVDASSRVGAREAPSLPFAAPSLAPSPNALPKGLRVDSEGASEGEPEGAPALPEQLSEREVTRLLLQGYGLHRVVRELTGLSGGERYQQLSLALSQWLVHRALRGG